jgi:hypothetical protein
MVVRYARQTSLGMLAPHDLGRIRKLTGQILLAFATGSLEICVHSLSRNHYSLGDQRARS